MQKIYGYNHAYVLEFIKFLKENKQKKLSVVFKEFALSKQKSIGTVRNMYYAIAKKSLEDKEFCLEYFGGIPIAVKKNKAFNKDEERELIKAVLIGRSKGESVRKTIFELALNDPKTALRYQNKFRFAVKNSPELIREITSEIRAKNGYEFIPSSTYSAKSFISDKQYQKLKTGIDGLINKITEKLVRENQFLKERLKKLEDENYKLKLSLYGGASVCDALDNLRKRDKNILS